MQVKIKIIRLAIPLLLSLTAAFAREKQPYQADWDSLAQHQAAPEWLKDAKLGIYFHWGVYTVPACGSEWYPRWMHFKGLPLKPDGKPALMADTHTAKFGAPNEYGYHDFIPQFSGSKFDARKWMKIFKNAGAKFAGPVAEHHDGFAMWDSKVTPWNSVKMGPKKDITRELSVAAKEENLKFITTFHHARNLQRYKKNYAQELAREKNEKGELIKTRHRFWNSHFPYIPGMPPTSEDSQLSMLYGNIEEDKWCRELWFPKLKEVIDQYQPDIIWFDSWLDLIPEQYRQEFCAYYLNESRKLNKEVAIIRKEKDLPLDFTVLDHEKARESKISEKLWMTDDTISEGSWSYVDGLKVKPAYQVIHSLIDTVAKNGILLLNVSPKADGTIPRNQLSVLAELGDWLKLNGEAIYRTRPFIAYGEGPVQEPDGGKEDRHKFLALRYSADDIRYTRSKDGKVVYAIFMGIPQEGSRRVLRTFAQEKFSIKKISLIGGDTVQWALTKEGLEVVTPATQAQSALTLKIVLN